MASPVKIDRVVSLDALRGFTMVWITGGREILLGLIALAVHPIPGWLAYETDHAEWIGFTAWDLIMPLFLFIVGVAMPFSFSKRLRPNEAYGSIYRRMARRVALLWLLGLIAEGNLIFSLSTLDLGALHLYANTLQAIACGYVISALALLHLPRWGQGSLCVALLLAYGTALAFVPFGGHAAGTLLPDANVALYVDEVLLGRCRDGSTYTWILSSLGFGATVLLGNFGGHVLRDAGTKPGKLIRLAALGLAGLLFGALCAQFQPIIKHIWTPAMVLWAGGWSYLLLALFFAVMDMGEITRWAYPLVVIGANAIVSYLLGGALIYAANEVLGTHESISAGPAMLAAGLAAFGVQWLLLWTLYRRRIFIHL